MPGHPEHVGQDYLPELPKLTGIMNHTTEISDLSKNPVFSGSSSLRRTARSEISRYGIISAVRKRIAAQNTPGCQKAALQKSVFFNSLDCII